MLQTQKQLSNQAIENDQSQQPVDYTIVIPPKSNSECPSFASYFSYTNILKIKSAVESKFGISQFDFNKEFIQQDQSLRPPDKKISRKAFLDVWASLFSPPLVIQSGSNCATAMSTSIDRPISCLEFRFVTYKTLSTAKVFIRPFKYSTEEGPSVSRLPLGLWLGDRTLQLRDHVDFVRVMSSVRADIFYRYPYNDVDKKCTKAWGLQVDPEASRENAEYYNYQKDVLALRAGEERALYAQRQTYYNTQLAAEMSKQTVNEMRDQVNAIAGMLSEWRALREHDCQNFGRYVVEWKDKCGSSLDCGEGVTSLVPGSTRDVAVRRYLGKVCEEARKKYTVGIYEQRKWFWKYMSGEKTVQDLTVGDMLS